MWESIVAMALLAGKGMADYPPFKISSVTVEQRADCLASYVDFGLETTTNNVTYQAYCRQEWTDDTSLFVNDCPLLGGFANPSSSRFSFEIDSYNSPADFSLHVTQTINYTDNPTPYETILESVSYEFTNQFTNLSNPNHCTNSTLGVFCFTTDTDILPVASASPACDIQPNVEVGFSVLERTYWGDNLFISGNISELGDWDPYNAYPMTASQYNDTYPLWFGGFVFLPAGTAFEYKYIKWAVGGALEWECGDNRVYTVPDDSCGLERPAGDDAEYFRCGNGNCELHCSAPPDV